MIINIISSSRYKIDRKLIKVAAEELVLSYPVPKNSSLNIIFVGKNKMKNIAKKYKGEDEALPVLSFSYFNEPLTEEKTLGEIFVCYPQAILLAAQRDKKVDNILSMLVKHGVENIFK